MEILDVAREQLNSADQRKIFENYRDLFEVIIEFGPENPNYLQAARKRVEELDENVAQKGSNRIEEIVKEGELKTALSTEL